jgi:hypothetical protein
MPDTNLTEFSIQVREAETVLAHLVDIASHAKFIDLTPGDKRQLDTMRDIKAGIGDAGFELLRVQELMHNLLAHMGD